MPNLQYIIHELLPNPESVDQSMRRLIDAHAQKYPDSDWSPFFQIPYDREIFDLQQEWFAEVIKNDPPARVPVAGLWFGLFNPIRGRGRKCQTVADFYVSGAQQFQLDSNGDWATNPAYFPEGRFALSEVLAMIYRTAYSTPNGPGIDAEQYLCLGYVCFALKFILTDIDLDLIMASDEPVGVAAGWDSGDPLYLGFITRNGFQIRDPQEAIAGIKKLQEEFDRLFRQLDEESQ